MAAVIYQWNQWSRCNGKFAHHQTSPVYQGPGAVDNVIFIEKPAATEARCGIELSPCSAACPLGTIYTSFWPDICVGILGGTSAAPLSVGLPSEFGFADQTTPLPG
ncbi:hypothetical protein THAOC_00623 [Thalassiosira oceanica]|uniref:Uncharacterized protein n=1 Tax=Thalassiosira oceanica TaxID=159749 RepID=K0TRC1_THAOC|nr:hypothetical protein THAOC_00623 [Thalassiosira oceanica]|eukprot:EJK77537.1 hypothetical protein THAOC_00623 [Thalassiosira oceanica]